MTVLATSLAQSELLPSASSSFAGLAGAIVVLLLLAAVAWMARQGGWPLRPNGARPRMSLETALSLGERRSLVVVSVENRRLLLGVTQGAISLISELGPAPEFRPVLDARMGASEGPR